MSFSDISNFISTNAQTNQFFQGAIGAAVVGGVLLNLKKIVFGGWALLVRLTSVSLTVNNEDRELYAMLNKWIEEEGLHKSIRNVEVTFASGEYKNGPVLDSPSINDTQEHVSYLSNNDFYYSFYNKLPVKITFSAASTEMSREVKRTVNIIFYFRGSKFINKIQDKIKGYVSNKKITQQVLTIKNFTKRNNGVDWVTGQCALKPLETVYLPNKIKNELTEDISKFLKSRSIYNTMGKVYKRNYLLVGPPGTGKSSLAKAVASAFNKKLNLVITHAGDEEFLESMAYSENGVILLEDVDCSGLRTKREDNASGISLSTLLNALDGVNSKPDTITIVTTNNPENLDPALMRTGRIDKIIHLNYLNEAELSECLEFFAKMFDVKLNLTKDDFNTVKYNNVEGYRPSDISEKVFGIVA